MAPLRWKLALFILILAVLPAPAAGVAALQPAPAPQAAQLSQPQPDSLVTAAGEYCDIECFPWTIVFNPAGGPIGGAVDFERTSDLGDGLVLHLRVSGEQSGYFEGGDGGKITGRLSGHAVDIDSGTTVDTFTLDWVGNLYADGTGKGRGGEGFENASWSVTFDPQAFQAPPAALDWDLGVAKIDVLQAVEGGRLVGDWGAGARVYLTWSGPTPSVFATVELLVDGSVALAYDGRVFQKCPAGYGAACSINFPLPASILPAGEHSITARARLAALQDGSEQMPDPNLANNELSTGSLAFQAIRPSITLLMAALDKKIGKQQIVDFLASALPFLKDVYPLPEIRVAPAAINLYDPVADMRSSAIELDMFRYTYNSAAWAARQAGQTTEPGADFAVGLFHSGYFGADVEGVSVTLFRATPLVPLELPEALAHEIGHYYLGGEEEYQTAPNGIGNYLPAGVSIYKRQERQFEDLGEDGALHYINFMGSVSRKTTWVNPATWDRLVEKLAPGWFGSPLKGGKNALARQNPAPGTGGFLVSGTLAGDGTLNITHRLWLDYLEPSAGAERAGSRYALEALDQDGRRLARAAVEIDLAASDPAPFLAVLAAPAGAAQLALTRDDQPLARWQRSARPPAGSITGPSGDVSGSFEIHWQASDPDGEPASAALLFSPDDGASWLPLAVNPGGPTVRIDPANLPGCQRCRLKLLASDGWQTSAADAPGAFRLPDQAPALAISSPGDGAQLDGAQLQVFQATAYDLEDGLLTGVSITWSSDVDGALGSGERLEPGSLSSGRHILTVTARDSAGGEARRSMAVTVTGGKTPQPAPRLPVIPDNLELGQILLILGGLAACAGLALALLGAVVWLSRRRQPARPPAAAYPPPYVPPTAGGTPSRAQYPAQKRPRAAGWWFMGLAAAALGLCCLLSAGGWLFWRLRPEPEPSYYNPPAPSAEPQAVPTLPPAEVTPLPTSEPAAERELYRDDFSDPASGWPDIRVRDDFNTYYYEDAYLFTILQAAVSAQAGPGETFPGDARVEVDARMAAGSPYDEFGPLCRYSENSDGTHNSYYFAIAADGLGVIYKIDHDIKGPALAVTSSARPDAVRPAGEANHIRADCLGDRLTLYANGQLLLSATDSAFSGGGAGLRVDSESGGTQIHFDQFTVYGK